MRSFENVLMRNDKENIIVDLTFKFALKIVEFSELLVHQRNKFQIAIFSNLIKRKI